jgi:hypothetical protein
MNRFSTFKRESETNKTFLFVSERVQKESFAYMKGGIDEVVNTRK